MLGIGGAIVVILGITFAALAIGIGGAAHHHSAAATSAGHAPATAPPAAQATTAPDVCSQLVAWRNAGGLADSARVAKDLGRLSKAALAGLIVPAEGADSRRLQAATATAMNDPPPGAAGRSAYTKAMTDFNTAALQAEAGNLPATTRALNVGSTALGRAAKLIKSGC